MLEKASMTAVSMASGAELIRVLGANLRSQADIGNGMEQSFPPRHHDGLKGLLAARHRRRIFHGSGYTAAFCRMDPRHAFRQQAILSTRFSSPNISGMIAAKEREQHRCQR